MAEDTVNLKLANIKVIKKQQLKQQGERGLLKGKTLQNLDNKK